MSIEREQRLKRAETAVRQGRIDTAIAEYEALVAEQPEDLSAGNALGDLLVRAGRSPEALPHYRRVGDIYLREGFFSKAAGFYRKVLKFVPHDEDATLRLAQALAEQGLSVEARTQLLNAVQLRRRRHDDAGADELLVRAAELDPKHLDAPSAEGDVPSAPEAIPTPVAEPGAVPGDILAEERGEMPEEPRTLEAVFDRLRVEAGPRRGTEGRQLLALGRTYLAAGMAEAAIETFRRAAQDGEARAVAAVALSETYEELEEPALALEWLEHAADAQESPEADRLDASRRLAEMLERAGEPERALAVWLEIVTMNPGDVQAAGRIARLSSGDRRS